MIDVKIEDGHCALENCGYDFETGLAIACCAVAVALTEAVLSRVLTHEQRAAIHEKAQSVMLEICEDLDRQWQNLS